VNILQDVSLVLHLVKQLQPLASEFGPPATKRARLEMYIVSSSLDLANISLFQFANGGIRN
jgi:hypothetical protein